MFRSESLFPGSLQVEVTFLRSYEGRGVAEVRVCGNIVDQIDARTEGNVSMLHAQVKVNHLLRSCPCQRGLLGSVLVECDRHSAMLGSNHSPFENPLGDDIQ